LKANHNYIHSVISKHFGAGDIVQYLKADRANYNHVAIYAGNNNMFSSSSSMGMIVLQTFFKFNKTVTPHFYHYVGK
jgi:hypothetical protein